MQDSNRYRRRSDQAPHVGQLRVMEGRLAMCVNPMASYGGWSGPLWAIEGVRYKFSLRGGPTGYQEGFCEKVDPRCPTVTFRMIPRGWDEETPLEECRSFFCTEIGRLNPEYPGWMLRRWSDLRKAQQALKANDFDRLKVKPGPWLDFVPEGHFWDARATEEVIYSNKGYWH